MPSENRNHKYANILSWWYETGCIKYSHKEVERGSLDKENPDLFIDADGNQWDFIIIGPCSRAELRFCLKKYRLEKD
jgi:hypothetical protein